MEEILFLRIGLCFCMGVAIIFGTMFYYVWRENVLLEDINDKLSDKIKQMKKEDNEKKSRR